YFFSCVAERLRIGKVQRCWESYAQIVTEPVLRQRHSVAIRDLSAWRRNIENKSARQLLRLESGDNCLFFRRSARTRCRRLHEREEQQHNRQPTYISPD